MLLSVPLVFIFFILIFTIGYLVLSRFSTKGLDHKEKYLPYTGGQNFPPRVSRLSYQEFFKTGLLFGIIHVSALVISTLPIGWDKHQIGLIYVLGIGISVSVLTSVKSK